MAGKIKKLVVSDFHLSDGQEEGELNPWENFHHDEKFAELLRYYSTDYYEDEDDEDEENEDDDAEEDEDDDEGRRAVLRELYGKS